MRNNQALRKIVALILLSVMLSVTINRFCLKIEFFDDLQSNVSKKVYLSADDNEAHQVLKDLKRPIFSFYDNVSSLDCQLLPQFAPHLTHIDLQVPFEAVPEVYPEIPVPPDELC